jgi:uncharacterized membrane protein
MAIGPVQLIVLGFADPDFHGQIAGELDKLRASDTVRVIDALVVYKDSQGEVEVRHASNLTEEEGIEFGSKVGALIGLGVGGEEGAAVGAEAGAEAGAEGTQFFSDEEAWDVVADLPENTACALILLEHHWAVGLRDAIYSVGGFPIGSAFITPLDLVSIGLLSAEEAEAENAAAAPA